MKRLWIPAFLLSTVAAFAQDPQPDRLKEAIDRIAELQAAVADLTARVGSLNEEIDRQQEKLLSRAREVRDLKQINQELRKEIGTLKKQVTEAGRAGQTKQIRHVHGPQHPMTGYVIAIAKEYGFILATIEKKHEDDEIQMDYTFDVQRNAKLIARGTVTRIIAPNQLAKKHKIQLKITRGAIPDIMVGDSVVAQRKLVIGKEPEGAAPAEEPARIDGQIGKELFPFNRGRRHGLRIGDRVYVYRGKELIATLRLDTVDAELSIGRVEAGFTKRPAKGDAVEFEEIGGIDRPDIIGRVVYSDREIVLDVGTRHRARPGQKFEVRRNGQRVGFVAIRDAHYDTSIAEPVDGTQQKDLHKGDVIELVQD